MRSIFPPLENYLGKFTQMNFRDCGLAWNDIREFLPNNCEEIYNKVDLIPALSYREIRNFYGKEVDIVIQKYIDLDKERALIRYNRNKSNVIGGCIFLMGGITMLSFLTAKLLQDKGLI